MTRSIMPKETQKMLLVGAFALLSAITFVGCQKVSALATRPLASVAGHKLYLADVPGLSSEGLTSEDSAQIIDKYIKVWATEKLVVREAEKNIGSNEEIEMLMERYRQSLLVYEYQLQLVQEVMRDKLSEKEVRAYYDNHLDLFLANEPLYRGFYILVTSQTSDMDAFRMLISHPDEGNLDILESLCIKNAAKLENFSERWRPFSDIQKNVPIALNAHTMMKANALYETHEGDLTFIAYIEEFQPEGLPQPFAYAEPRVRSTVSERRKAATLKKFEKDLYNDALKSGDLKIYKR